MFLFVSSPPDHDLLAAKAPQLFKSICAGSKAKNSLLIFFGSEEMYSKGAKRFRKLIHKHKAWLLFECHFKNLR